MVRASRPLELVPRPVPQSSGTEAARRFGRWTDDQLAALTMGEEKPSPVAVHRAVLRLTWQFFYERKGAEPEHRDRVTDENGEPCIYGLFLEALEKLHELHMAAEKLELIEKAPVPTAPAAPQPRPRSVAEAMAAALQDVI